MANYLAQIADRVLNQPLLLTPEKLAVIAHVLEGRIDIDAGELAAQFKAEGADDAVKVLGSRYIGEFELSEPDNPRSAKKSYRTTKQGAAIIPVHGSLVNRGGWLDAMSGLTSYEKLKFQVGEAAKDRAVQSILLDIDSPGGEAVGAFEAADAIRQAGQVKPVIAIANGLCCSAAYALASGATKIVTSRSSLVGSIGTFILHLDRSKQLADMGVKPTLIAVGKRKGDGLPHFELSDEVKGELRSYAIRINNLFISTVAANRPRTTAESILALEAGVFIGAEAIEHGLADEVGSFEAALEDVHRGASRSFPAKPRGSMMAKENEPAATGFSQEQMNAAVSTARAEALTAGASAERDRFKSVLGHEAYKGRETSAHHMLLTTDMSADAIAGVLAGLPSAAAAAPEAPKDRAKDAPGGLATVDPASGVQASAGNDPAAAWSKQIERVNARVG